jgi:hypothetical protein
MIGLRNLAAVLGLLFPGLGSRLPGFSSRRGLSLLWTIIIIIIIIIIGSIIIYLLLTQPTGPTY